MPKPRSPNREKAKNLWLESNGNIALKDIARELGISDVQVRKWKNEDKWALPISNVTKQKKGNAKSNVADGVTNKKPKNKSSIVQKEPMHDEPQPPKPQTPKTNTPHPQARFVGSMLKFRT